MSARAAPLARAIGAQLRIELLLTLRRGETLLITFAVPLLLLVFFGSVPLLPSGGGPVIDFLLPGILALAVMSTGMVGLGIATAFERQYGVLKRLGGSPLPRGGLLAAKVGSVLLVQLVQAIVLILVAATLFGWRPQGNLGAAVLAVILGTTTFAGLGLLMAGSLRAEATLAAANGLYLLLLLLGDMVFPLSQLPPWLAAVAGLLPAAAFAGALRSALQPGGTPAAGGLAILAAWSFVSLIAAARGFRWE